MTSIAAEKTHSPAPIDLMAAFDSFTDSWSPRVAATYNQNDVMLVRLTGPFHWHTHADTDDLFLVLSGELDIELRDRIVTLKAGQLFVVPAGVEHRPVARGEVRVLIMEPTGTPNTGDPDTAAPRKLLGT